MQEKVKKMLTSLNPYKKCKLNKMMRERKTRVILSLPGPQAHQICVVILLEHLWAGQLFPHL